MNDLVTLDKNLALIINGLSGHSFLLDEIVKGLANDYFLPVVFCLVMVVLWFTPDDAARRELNQKGVLQTLLSLGIANAIVATINALFYRSRPFIEIPVQVLPYKPGDSSLPSNAATVLFAIAMAVWLRNRKVGGALLILAAIEALGRIYVGMHYPLDVLSGAVLGVFIGWVVGMLSTRFDLFVSRALGLARRLVLA